MSIVLSTEPMRRRNVVPGILVSLALHAALIFGYRLAAPMPPPELSPNRTMTVWLLPTPAPAAPAIPAQSEMAPRLATQTAATRERRDAREEGERSRSRQRTHETPVHDRPSAAITAATPTPAPTDTTVVADTAKPAGADYDPLRAPAEPKPFDIEAARKAARKVAVEKPAPGTLAAQLQTHPLYPEDDRNKLEKDMARAGRPDCLKSGGNLLTPLFWLLDKKDHGCKL
ncbi:hypothetical protein [Duganella sp. FT27W]|uniref:hypothetical protein n=1 Tax=Duganella sp. FT27W TaxID=2654636 RepID=UPI00128E9358|nr:hypothetical protein [Duganella sp. FT27W]MPQ59111.1 hypothetical protein [Duganella sp. FT27W]